MRVKSLSTGPAIEAMESRTFLSAAPAPSPLVTDSDPVPVITVLKTVVHFHGKLTGTFSHVLTNPDAGNAYSFSATGNLGAVGTVSASASIKLPGFVAKGNALGTLTLTTSTGTLTLKLAGPLEKGFGPMPSAVRYYVSSGTGAYANASGAGNIGITLAPKGDGLTLNFC